LSWEKGQFVKRIKIHGNQALAALSVRAVPEPHPQADTVRFPLNTSLRILLVEDHASTNAALTRLLGRDYIVYSADTAAKALELAKREGLDLVIADIGLPDKTGWELVKEIRAIHPHILSIALTGFDYVEDAHRFSAAGFDMHIPKPAHLAQITSAIKTLFPDKG
jgi:DNA-binding response OmpR family regulator